MNPHTVGGPGWSSDAEHLHVDFNIVAANDRHTDVNSCINPRASCETSALDMCRQFTTQLEYIIWDRIFEKYRQAASAMPICVAVL